MNKVILMGRLARDPELRYSQGSNQLAITRYSLAVSRQYKREGQPDVDFINIVAFGKSGEFAEKFFKKGMMVAITGRMQVSSYDDKDGNKKWSTDVIVEEQHFAESKASFESHRNSNNNMGQPNFTPQKQATPEKPAEGFFPIDDNMDDDLPF